MVKKASNALRLLWPRRTNDKWGQEQWLILDVLGLRGMGRLTA